MLTELNDGVYFSFILHPNVPDPVLDESRIMHVPPSNPGIYDSILRKLLVQDLVQRYNYFGHTLRMLEFQYSIIKDYYWQSAGAWQYCHTACDG